MSQQAFIISKFTKRQRNYILTFEIFDCSPFTDTFHVETNTVLH